MLQHRTAFIVFAAATAASAACGTQPAAVESAERMPQAAKEGSQLSNGKTPISQRFRTLDDYLRYLERESHRDGKWYKQIRPGVYEVQTGNLHLDTDTQQRIFTREELAKKFGFPE